MIILIKILTTLFSLSKTQNYLSLSWLYQQKITKKYQFFLAKVLEDQFIEKKTKKVKSENKNIKKKKKKNQIKLCRIHQGVCFDLSNGANDGKRYSALNY